jgi:hypothetical protein
MRCGIRGATIAALLACSLASCLPPPRLENTPPVVKTDEFSKTIEIRGPARRIDFSLGYYVFYNLFTVVDKQTHSYRHQLGVDVVYDTLNQIGYRYAADDTAQSLRLTTVARTRSRVCKDCTREEVFDVDLPDAALRSHMQSGYRIKMSSVLKEYLIVEILPQMIAAQYAALEQVIGPAAARPPERLRAPATQNGALDMPADPNAPGAKTNTVAPPPQPPAGLATDRNIGLEMLPQSTGAMTHGSMHGAVILAVIPGSAAEAAGVRGGDLIVKLDGKPVESGKEILDLFAKAKPHSIVTVDILRGSAHVVARIKL